MQINFISQDDAIPSYLHKTHDAGYDLYASETTWLWPFKVKKIKLNIAVELPMEHFGLVTSRSGESSKGNFVIPGIIDCNYRGQVSAIMTRIGLLPTRIKKGTRIAQMVIIPYRECELYKVDKLNDSSRGESGFGSSGLH